jgi:hypothetical protein
MIGKTVSVIAGIYSYSLDIKKFHALFDIISISGKKRIYSQHLFIPAAFYDIKNFTVTFKWIVIENTV